MDSLFTSLRKYRPRENTDPIENFITEAFAWLLRKDEELSRYFINDIAQRLANTANNFSVPSGEISWSTQLNYGGVFPDMEATWLGMTLVFEHKVWSKLHDGQLKNYRDYHESSDNDYRMILITGHYSQYDQNPDLALCWHDIYVLLNHYLAASQQRETTWVINDFLQLLKSEGLGPAAPISHTAICHYQEAITLRSQLEALMSRIATHQWPVPDYQSEVKKKEGVVGIQFYRGNSENIGCKNWTPGVLVGFMLEGWDHLYESRLKDGLKFILNLSITHRFHDVYLDLAEYKELTKELADKAANSSRDWTFYHHRAQANPFNPWHPLYLEYPMLDVFKGTETTAEQEQRFIEIAEEALSLLVSCPAFEKLTAALEK